MTQLNEIFNLILQMAAFVGMMPDVVVETTELCGVSLGPVLAEGLRPAIVNLLLGGHKNIPECLQAPCTRSTRGHIFLPGTPAFLWPILSCSDGFSLGILFWSCWTFSQKRMVDYHSSPPRTLVGKCYASSGPILRRAVHTLPKAW